MHFALWDTRRLDVSKDFAGGFGVGQFVGGNGVRSRIVRHFYKRDRRPVALHYAYLAAILRKQGHTVEYTLDQHLPPADVYVFNPSLITLHLERHAMAQALAQTPPPKVLVVGTLTTAVPEAFQGLEVTLVRGEPEQLHWKLDEALSAPAGTIDVGSVRELDALPYPDWSPFDPKKFRIAYDFSRFPTALVQQSRGCTFTCNYCPYILVESKTRFRSPESVADEMAHGMRTHGFRSFKFRDPLFGLDRKRALELAERIARLPHKIQFSIESRIDLLRDETLKALKRAGLTSVTIGIETPDEETLRRYKRTPIRDDRQREFVELCRKLRIRTVAGFMIGFPSDTARSVHDVLRYAKQLNPTFANFNIVTPYPGTAYFGEVRGEIVNWDFTRYNVYTPVMRYEHLTAEQLQKLHARCFESYYFRWRYLAANARQLWSWLPAARETPAPSAPAPLADEAHVTPRPLGGSGLMLDISLRQDGPHLANGKQTSRQPKPQ